MSLPTGPGQSPASLEKDLNGLKEEDTGCRLQAGAQRLTSLKLTSFSILSHESEND